MGEVELDCKSVLSQSAIKSDQFNDSVNKKRKLLSAAKNSESNDGDNTNEIKKIKLIGDYFELVSEFIKEDYKHKQVEVQCKLCEKKTILKGVYGVTSNFLKHLRRLHPENYDLYEKERAESLPNKTKSEISKTKNEKRSENRKSSKSKNIKHDNTEIASIRTEKTPAKIKIFDKKVLKFIICTMSPLRIVQNKAFKDLFEETQFEVMTKRTAQKKLEFSYIALVKLLKHKISRIQYCCTTVDLWSYKKCSFFGITCHWLDEQLKRHSATLCCKKFFDICSHDEIEKLITEIHEKFDITSKLVATISDNTINFIGALEEFGIDRSLLENCPVDNEIFDYNIDSFPEEIRHEYITNIEHLVPQHIRSASHTISLVSTIDFLDYLKSNFHLIEKNRQVFAKCTLLWLKTKNPKANEIITKTLGHSLSCPVTKWNSVYEAANDILKNKNKLPELCEMLSISSFTDDELHYLHEYCIIMKPLADGLDFIQQEKNCYYGYLIPTLATIMTKFRKLEVATEIIYLIDAFKCLKESLIRRFYEIFTLQPSINDAIIASIVCPSVKIRWLNVMKETAPNFDIKLIDDQIINIMENIDQEQDSSTIKLTKTQIKMESSQPFFDFDEATDYYPSTTFGAGVEYYNYLNDIRTDNIALDEFPLIKSLFLKYNSPPLSYLAIEKLFSYAKIINAAQENHNSDEHFEKFILLKSNYSHFDEIKN